MIERLSIRLWTIFRPAGSLPLRPIVEQLYSLRVGGEGPRPNLRRFNRCMRMLAGWADRWT